MFNYECDCGPKNGETHNKPNVEHPQVISRINTGYFANEKGWEFVMEVLLFAIIVAISAWPIVAAAGALSEFLQRTPV